MINSIEGLDTLVTLQELDLYDNQIEKIENLDQLVNLKYDRLHYFVNIAMCLFLFKVLFNLTYFFQDFRSFIQCYQSG